MSGRVGFIMLIMAVILNLAQATTKFHLVLSLLDKTQPNTPSLSWERGHEILPAAQLAVQEINETYGHDIQLTVVSSQECDSAFSADVLQQILSLVGHEDNSERVIGIVGLFCPEQVEILAKLASCSDDFTLLPISASLSPQKFDLTVPSNFYRIVTSSTSFVHSLVSLMTHVGWTRIGVITESSDEYFLSTSEQLVLAQKGTHNLTVSPYIQLSAHNLDVSAAVRNLISFNSKINFISVSAGKACDILCTAYENNLAWPEYAWIFHSYFMSDLQLCHSQCDIQKATEGIFLLLPNLESQEVLNFPSVNKYKAYKKQLSLNNQTINPFLDVLYDSIWLYLCAINHILEHDVSSINTTLSDNVHFPVPQNIHIWQIQEELSIILVARFSPTNDITFIAPFDGKIPSDELPVDYSQASLTFGVIVFFSVELVLGLIALTLILALYLYFRNEPEVKSTSVLISLLMFLGCYLLLFFFITLIIRAQPELHVRISKKVNVCLFGVWFGGIGIPVPIILSALLVKMLRVYRIFNLYKRLGRVSSNIALFAYVMLLLLPNLVIMFTWMAVDTYSIASVRTTKQGRIQEVYLCTSKYLIVWVAFLVIYMFSLIFGVIVVAIKTRKIREKNFKDTKKVNALLFLAILAYIFTIFYWLLLVQIGADSIYTAITFNIGHVVPIVVLQGLLFVPKIYPPLRRSLTHQKFAQQKTSVATESTVVSITQ